MARSNGNSNKREKEKQRQKEKLEKREKMEERRANQAKGKPLEDMLAYVDEDGNISSTPPDPSKAKIVNAEDIEIGVPKRTEIDDPLKQGRVDHFDSSKGFGFIMQDNGERIFFHISRTTYQVSEGDQVNFTLERGPRGWNAVDVSKKP